MKQPVRTAEASLSTGEQPEKCLFSEVSLHSSAAHFQRPAESTPHRLKFESTIRTKQKIFSPQRRGHTQPLNSPENLLKPASAGSLILFIRLFVM